MTITLLGGLGTSRRNRLFPKSMKYLTIAKRSSFAVVITTCFVPVPLKPSLCKLFPFLLEDFPRVFGRIKSRDLICIRLRSQK